MPDLAEYDDGTGVCRHLVDNLCAIYESRPLLCNAAAMYEAYFKEAMTEARFIAVNLEACRVIGKIFC